MSLCPSTPNGQRWDQSHMRCSAHRVLGLNLPILLLLPLLHQAPLSLRTGKEVLLITLVVMPSTAVRIFRTPAL